MSGVSSEMSGAPISDQYPARVRVIRAALVALIVLAIPAWMAASALADRWMLSLNLTNSLPGGLYLVERLDVTASASERQAAIDSAAPGDLIAFRAGEGGEPWYARDTVFIKRVVGVAGDAVVFDPFSNMITVDGYEVGRVKVEARDGTPLNANRITAVPEGELFVSTPHPDSFDSRYEAIGTISAERLVGLVRFSF